MRTHPFWVLALVALIVCSGCDSNKPPPSTYSHDGSDRPESRMKTNPVSLLSTAEVRSIAAEFIRTNTSDLAAYSCKNLAFGGNSFDPNISNKWILRFAPPVQAPDSDVFIIVDDTDGKAEIWTWSRSTK